MRICARVMSPSRGRPSNAILSSSVRSSGRFFSAIAARPASSENDKAQTHLTREQEKNSVKYST